ncbi:glycosyltransferase family 28 domain-containing protein [Xylariales sp. AK1849]|nr:glycosyltransferase family 28 domain-containing protein [Xylariales sp. AK1849]
MPFGNPTSESPGRLEIGEGLSKTSSRVENDGRARVQFHRTPTALAAWFKRFQDAPLDSNHGIRKRSKQRDSSQPFLAKGASPKHPRLNIAIHVVGSRGDVQPFIPIAQLLSKPPYGHRVRICTHSSFKGFVEANGVEFFSIGGDPEALMAYMVKNPGLLPSRESFKAGDIGKRRKEMAEIMQGVWRGCIEAGDGIGPAVTASNAIATSDLFMADAIIANPPSMGHIHCAERLGIPLHMVFTMPWSPTRAFHHPLAAMNYGEAEASTANYLSFMLMELLTWQGLGDVINAFRTRTLNLDPISPLWGHQLLPRLRTPYTYLWSAALIPKPQDWGPHIRITGFSFLPQAQSYTPPQDLVDFLSAGPPPIYIGFGSIVLDDPKAVTQLIVEAVQKANARAIVSKGWGGIGGKDKVPDNIFLLGDCPHDWLFQQVSCVVHHGGAGTTAAGIAAGCSTVVVPFFGDQPFWGQMIAAAGAGPVPVPFKEMTADSLAASITFALKPDVRSAAKELAVHIAEEDGAYDAAKDIQDRLDIDSMRCKICPDRLASWKHKKTGIHLSNFAVACLIRGDLIQPHDIKPIRHRHWYVDEGAEDPLIGAVAAFSGLFMDAGTAIVDYSHRLKNTTTEKRRRPSISQLVGEKSDAQAAPTNHNSNTHGTQSGTNGPDMSVKQLEIIALKVAKRSRVVREEVYIGDGSGSTPSQTTGVVDWIISDKSEHGRAYRVTRASGRFVADLTKAGLKAPVALFYNVANGFHNRPSYSFSGSSVRRRDEITGFASGFKVAGKELTLGFYDAFSGLVLKPYRGARDQGAKGLGLGVYSASRDFFCNIGAATFGIPGYSLKGVEKGISKRVMTSLQAELILVKLRRAIDDIRQSSEADRLQVKERWKVLNSL